MKIQILLACLLALPALAAPQTAVYEVPGPVEFAPYSRFELPFEAKLLGDGRTEVSYSLPEVLLGNAKEFHFRGVVDTSAQFFTLTGEEGEMTCGNHEGSAQCRVTHRNVAFDLAAVSASLEKMNISLEEKSGRFGLASFLAKEGGDMIGILTYVPGLDYSGKQQIFPGR